MLFKVAVNNIKKKFSSYWAYFLSCSFSVFIVYLFISIINNVTVKRQLGANKDLMKLFYIGAFLIITFSVFFICYSNSFFIKSRKKEFATFMLLGVSKGQTLFINFIENFIILLFAFLVGIIAGIMMNKLFIMILFSMMKLTGNIPFTIDWNGILICSVIYGITFLIVIVRSAVFIYKENLINMINYSKKAERSLKVSWLTVIIGITAVLCLSYGYYQASIMNIYMNNMMLIIVPVVIGTALFFTSFVSLIIWLSKRNEKRLYNGTRLVSVSQLCFRYSGNVGSLSIIAITTSVALCAMLVLCGSFSKNIEAAHEYSPFSIEYYSNKSADSIFDSILKNHKEIKINSKVEIHPLDIKVIDPSAYENEKYFVLSESEFNALNIAQKNSRKVKLNKDTDCYLVQLAYDKDMIGKTFYLDIAGKKHPIFVLGADSNNYVAFNHFKQTIVVKDSIYNSLNESNNHKDYAINAYNIKNDMTAGNFINELQSNMPKTCGLLTYYDELDTLSKLTGMMLFIGIFTGILFLTATCSILYFKVTMEAQEDKERFAALIKIGMNRRELRSAVAKEIAVIFGAPFVMAAINSFAAVAPVKKILKVGGVMQSYILILAIYALLYGIYYIVSVNSYLRIITGSSYD